MVYTVDEISRRVAPIAKKHRLPAVYLFGSYASGSATESSDVDLIVDTSGTDIKGLFALGGLYNELETALGKKLDLVTVSSLKQPARMPSEKQFKERAWKEKVSLYAVG